MQLAKKKKKKKFGEQLIWLFFSVSKEGSVFTFYFQHTHLFTFLLDFRKVSKDAKIIIYCIYIFVAVGGVFNVRRRNPQAKYTQRSIDSNQSSSCQRDAVSNKCR